jgi:hypothetical protein
LVQAFRLAVALVEFHHASPNDPTFLKFDTMKELPFPFRYPNEIPNANEVFRRPRWLGEVRLVSLSVNRLLESLDDIPTVKENRFEDTLPYNQFCAIAFKAFCIARAFTRFELTLEPDIFCKDELVQGWALKATSYHRLLCRFAERKFDRLFGKLDSALNEQPPNTLFELLLSSDAALIRRALYLEPHSSNPISFNSVKHHLELEFNVARRLVPERRPYIGLPGSVLQDSNKRGKSLGLEVEVSSDYIGFRRKRISSVPQESKIGHERPPKEIKPLDDNMRKAIDAKAKGMSWRKVEKTFDVSRSTVIRRCKEHGLKWS